MRRWWRKEEYRDAREEKACRNVDGNVCKQLLLGSVEIYHVGQGLKRDEVTERQVPAS